MTVSCIWDALDMYVATELQQFKYQFCKSKSFNGSLLISSLFLFHLSRSDQRGIEVWVRVSFMIIQCFSYSKLLYNSRCCLIPFRKGHICWISKFMNTFGIVYSVKALFAVQLSTLFCLKMWKDIYFFQTHQWLFGCGKALFHISTDIFGGQINPGLTEPKQFYRECFYYYPEFKIVIIIIITFLALWCLYAFVKI